MRGRAAVGAAGRAALDHAGRAGRGRAPVRYQGGRAGADRDRRGSAGGDRAAVAAGVHGRGQPAVGPVRVHRRRGGGRGALFGGPAVRDRQPSALLRFHCFVGAGVRGRDPGPGGRRGLAAGRPGTAGAAVVGGFGGAARGDAGAVRRALPRQRGAALGGGGFWPGRPAKWRHDHRDAGRGPGDVRLLGAEPAAAVRGGGSGRGRRGGAVPVRPDLRRLVDPGAAVRRVGDRAEFGVAVHRAPGGRGLAAQAFIAGQVCWPVGWLEMAVAVLLAVACPSAPISRSSGCG